MATEGKSDVDAVIFDMGGVLTTSPAKMMSALAEQHDITLEQFLPIALGPLDTDGDHPWHEVERGRMSLADFREAIVPMWKAAGYSSFPSPPDDPAGGLRPVPEMLAAVTAVRAAGHATAILSNNIREWSSWKRMLNADSLVDVVVDSSDVGLRKPNPAIYQLTADRLGIAPDRCLFLDDFPWNLGPAAELGMRVQHVTDPVAGAAELLESLGL